MLETQNNLVKEVQETISAMNSIIKNTREEMMATTNSSQLLMTENMRNLTRALETIKDNMMGRIGGLDSNLADLNKRMDITNDAFNDTSLKMSRAMDEEFGRVGKVMNRFEDLMNESNKNMNERINLSEERQQSWRSEHEGKNHNFFKEVSNAMKSLKKQILKVNKDSGERDEELTRLLDDAKKLTEGMIRNLDEKATHLENLYTFKLDESTKVWENNLQLEVDKLLDALTKNTQVVQDDYTKRLNGLKTDLNKQFNGQLEKEIFRVKETIADTKKMLEESTNNKMKDTEIRLEKEFRDRFDAYRLKLDDSLREFTRMKNDLERIRKDYVGALEDVKDELTNNTKKEIENMKGQIVGKIKENNDEITDIVDAKVAAMKQEVDLNKEDMKRSVEAAKLHLDTELKTSTNDLKNMIDKNDQMIHADVNNKMSGLNTEVTTMRKFLVERMDEIHESTKSLARALVNEESANRAKQDEHIIKLFDRRINNLNDFIMSNIEQKLDTLRIELENKIKDALLELETFKRWVMDEFSNVRTEAEEFKQEFYARDYSDYLFLMAFQEQVSAAFDEVQKQFYNARGNIEKFELDSKERDSKLKEEIEAEAKERKKKVKALEEKDEELAETQESEKELGERTWEEFIGLYSADLMASKCSLSVVEEGVYESIRRIIASLSSLGGASSDLEERIKKTQSELKSHESKVEKQDKVNDGRFKEQAKEAKEIDSDYQGFKKVTMSNFGVTENALSILSNLLNTLESRAVADSLISQATMDIMEGRTEMQIAEVDGRLNLVNRDIRKKIDDDIKKEKREIVEVIIPGQIIQLKEGMGELDKKQQKNMGSLTEQMQQQLSRHEISIEDHGKELNRHGQRIKFCEENIKDAGEDMKKVGAAVSETNAQLISETIAQQAEIALLRENISLTIKDIFSAIGAVEKEESVKDGKTSDESAKLKKRMDNIEKKFEEVAKKSEESGVGLVYLERKGWKGCGCGKRAK